MKSRTLTSITVMTLFAALAIPVGLSGQKQDDKPKHHHYKLIDLGTLGGPSSYVNFNTDVLNNGETVIGSLQNAMPQPPTTNGFSCPPNIDVYKAFEWNDGVVTSLGALGDGNCSNAIWINAKGEIAGNAENGVVDPLTGINEIRAVRWEHGKIEDLGTLGGGQSGGQAINDRGDVVGFALNTTPDPYSIFDFLFLGSSNGTQTRAVVWRDGKAKDLGTLGGPDAAAWFVNNRGHIAGYSYTSDTPDSNTGIPPVRLVLWEQSATKDLGSLGGVGLPSINGFNNRGEVIGASPLPGDQSADPFLWDGAHLIDMAIEGKGGQFLDANVINDAGEVAGGAAFPGSPILASLWKDGIVTDLGAVGTDCFSEAWSISSSGQVGGTSVSCDGNTWRAFLWESGSMVDLRSLVSSGPDLQLVYAIGINDRGEIAGNGVPAGISTAPPFQDTMSHAFVLIPCDENHPNVEGCDYSLADGNATADVTQGSNIRSSITNFPGAPAVQLNRMRGGMLAGAHERFASRFRNALAAVSRAPYDLIASALNTYQIRINWQEASGQNQSGFNIYRCRGCSSPRTEGTKITSVGGTVFTYTDGSRTRPLTETSTYAYQVTAFSGSGESGPSNTSSAITKTEPAPTNLTSFAFVRGFDDVVRLSWTNNATDDDSYFVESCKGSTCTNFRLVAQLPANSTSDTQGFQFIHNITIRYRVRTHSPGGYSSYSNIRNQALP